MREVNLIVIHCSATPAGLDIGAREIDTMHRSRGFDRIGYHYVIRLDGRVEPGRAIQEVGAHAKGYNARSIGVCLIGGLDAARKPKETYTLGQWEALERVVGQLVDMFPDAKVCGHRDLSPDLNHDGKITPNEWMKSCPCFNVEPWQAALRRKIA